MGKKRIVKKTKEEVLKEREKREALLKKKVKVRAKKVKKGRIYISSSFNNTILTLADSRGNVLYWTSAGKVGFRGTKKGTSFAATRATKPLVRAIKKLKIGEISVFVKGIGAGRSSALKALASQDLNIVSIKDVTPLPHNGCRPPKPKRV